MPLLKTYVVVGQLGQSGHFLLFCIFLGQNIHVILCKCCLVPHEAHQLLGDFHEPKNGPETNNLSLAHNGWTVKVSTSGNPQGGFLREWPKRLEFPIFTS